MTPEGTSIYAVGDVHGRIDLLNQIQSAIKADARTTINRKVLVYVGDYIDRGEGVREVLDKLIDDPLPGFESVFLKGNHEEMLLRYLDDGSYGSTWMMNGGVATLRSYGVTPKHLGPGKEGNEEARRSLLEALPPRHLAFLRGLGLYHVEGGYLFVHAGLRPGIAFEAQDPADFLWIRDDFLRSDESYPWVVVHGHSVCPHPDIRPNRIGIDTGAYKSDTLTCLVLEGTERRFIQT